MFLTLTVLVSTTFTATYFKVEKLETSLPGPMVPLEEQSATNASVSSDGSPAQISPVSSPAAVYEVHH